MFELGAALMKARGGLGVEVWNGRHGVHQVAQKSIISGPSSANSCRVVEVPSNKRILILGMIFSVVILSAERDVNRM